jgi:uncharacterized membrane protein YkgB
VGALILRYGLVLVIAWIGLMKFTEYEAKGIQLLVAHSPLMSWMYGIVTVRQFSNALGIVEVSIAILIGFRHWSAKASAIGSALAVLMFLTTLSFLFFNSRMGAEPRRVSCSFRSGRAILNKGCGSAWRCNMVAGRSIGPGMLSPT